MPDRRESGAVALAALWNLITLFAANLFAVRAGWWSFGGSSPILAGLPVGAMFGWIFLWGVVGPLLRLNAFVVAIGFGFFDLVTMALLDPLVVLGDRWLVGEAFLLVVVAVPGLLLAQWTRDATHLAGRSRLQVGLFVLLLGWFLPQLAAAATLQDLRVQIESVAFRAALAAIGCLTLPGLVAVHEFFPPTRTSAVAARRRRARLRVPGAFVCRP